MGTADIVSRDELLAASRPASARLPGQRGARAVLTRRALVLGRPAVAAGGGAGTVVDEAVRNLFTIYGGKFTTYRALCQQVGDQVAARLSSSVPSGTLLKENWFLDELKQVRPELFRSDPRLRQQ